MDETKTIPAAYQHDRSIHEVMDKANARPDKWLNCCNSKRSLLGVMDKAKTRPAAHQNDWSLLRVMDKAKTRPDMWQKGRKFKKVLAWGNGQSQNQTSGISKWQLVLIQGNGGKPKTRPKDKNHYQKESTSLHTK